MTSLPVQYSKRSAMGGLSAAFRAPPINFSHFACRRSSYAKRLGIAYQKKVEVFLTLELPKVEFQPHFRFSRVGREAESCFPDAIIDRGSSIVIVEIKLRHTYDAYAQLTRLYSPVVSKIYEGSEIRRLEICKQYDPAVKLPEPVDLITDLNEWLMRDKPNYGVYIWGK